MPRLSDTERAELLQAKLAQVKARISKNARKRRTRELIAFGLLLERVLRRPQQDLAGWSGAAKELPDRLRVLAWAAIDRIAADRKSKT